jgi:hypothetical protein
MGRRDWPAEDLDMRKFVHRLAIVFIAAAFQGIAAIDGSGLHACPHHAQLPTSSSEQPAEHDGHHGSAGHGGHGAQAHAANEGHEHGEDAGPCTCLGSCRSGDVSPEVPSGTVVSLAAPAEALVPAPAPRAFEQLPAPPAHWLPFSQGPPRAI